MAPERPPTNSTRALLVYLEALGAKPGYFLYAQTFQAWAEARGLSGEEAAAVLARCVDRGFLERSDSLVQGAHVLTAAGMAAIGVDPS